MDASPPTYEELLARCKRAEAELETLRRKQGESAFARFCRMASDLICVADIHTSTFLQVNPAFTETLGYTEEELLERPFLDFVHPDDVEATRRVVEEQLRRGEEVFSFRNRYRCKDGSYRVLNWNSHPLPEEGKTYAIAHDVTERVRAEEAMRRSQERLRQFLDASPDMFFMKDPTLHYLMLNRANAEFFGRNSEEIVGLTDADLMPPDAAQGCAHTDLLALSEKRTVVDTERVGERIYETRKFPVIYGDEVAGVGGIIRDITDQERTAEELQRLGTAIEQTGEVVVVTDMEGTIQYVNPAFEKVTEYTREEVIGENPRILQSGKQDGTFYEGMWKTLTSGETWEGTLVNRRKGGTLYTEEATISPVVDKSGRVVNYVAVKRDVTRELALEEQYRQAQKMEAIGQLTGGVAHDFNNLLQVVNGNADLALVDLEEDHPARGSVEQILKAGERAAGLVDQLLAFGRRQVMRPEALDLNAVVTEWLAVLGRVLGEHVQIKWSPAPKIPAVQADRRMIEQALMNLCVNARDAMPDGGTLSVRTLYTEIDEDFRNTHAWAQRGQYVEIDVSDTGVGIAPEVLEHIFEPFYTTKEVGKGTGLGLATVYGIAKQHGGMVHATSRKGVGTTFRLFLPVGRPMVSEA